MVEELIVEAGRSVRQASHLLITAGAGLTAAAGYAYGDERRFAQLFPALVKLGFRTRAELIGRRLPPPLLWGYWARHVHDVRYRETDNPVYATLRRLVAERDAFVWTSNVDSFFPRTGFDPRRLFTPQGDYGRLQCVVPCRQDTWDFQPVLQPLLASIDDESGRVTDTGLLPRCPWCGGPAFLNVRLGPEFVQAPYLPGLKRLDAWLGSLGGAPLVVLELGAGFNTPGVVRWPGERLVRGRPHTQLIRINTVNAEIPPDLEGSLGVRADIADVVRRWASEVGT